TLPGAAPAPESALAPDDSPVPATAGGRPRGAVFLVLAVLVLAIDQLAKSWVAASFQVGVPVPVIGEAVRITVSHNQGALFGLFQGSAVAFGLVSFVVVCLIVWYEARAGGSLLVSIALGLL